MLARNWPEIFAALSWGSLGSPSLWAVFEWIWGEGRGKGPIHLGGWGGVHTPAPLGPPPVGGHQDGGPVPSAAGGFWPGAGGADRAEAGGQELQGPGGALA